MSISVGPAVTSASSAESKPGATKASVQATGKGTGTSTGTVASTATSKAVGVPSATGSPSLLMVNVVVAAMGVLGAALL